MHHLDVRRHVSQHAKHDHTRDRARRSSDHEVADSKQLHRDQRILRLAFHQHEQCGQHGRCDAQADDDRAGPGIIAATPGEQQNQRASGPGHQNRAGDVQAGARAALRQLEVEEDHQDGDHSQWHVEPQRPTPAGAVCEEATQQRPQHGAQTEDGAHDAHVAASIAGGNHVGDDGLRADHQAAGAEALHTAGDDHHVHALRQRAQDGADQEQGYRYQVQRFAPHLVTQFAVDGHADGHGQQEAGDDPAHLVGAAELADEGGQGGGEDHLPQGRHQHAEHQAAED